MEIDESIKQVIIDLFTDIMHAHKDPSSCDYNECEIDPCHWCSQVQNIIDTLKKEDG